jgi:hypothetical protein
MHRCTRAQAQVAPGNAYFYTLIVGIGNVTTHLSTPRNTTPVGARTSIPVATSPFSQFRPTIVVIGGVIDTGNIATHHHIRQNRIR